MGWVREESQHAQDDIVYCELYLWVLDESYKKASKQDDTVYSELCTVYCEQWTLPVSIWDESYKKASTQDDTVYCELYL